MKDFRTVRTLQIASNRPEVKVSPAWFFGFAKEENFSISSINAIVPRQKGIEVTFATVSCLKTFVSLIKEEHGVTLSGYDNSTVVSIIGVPHELSEEAMLGCLKFYGTVHASKRCTYPEFPQVENGNRLYRMEIRRPIPSTLNFGNRYVWVRYQGQIRTCLKCGSSDHLASDGEGCKVTKCRKCGEVGHLEKDCKGETLCSICQKKGHRFTECGEKFQGKAIISHTWAQVVAKPKNTITPQNAAPQNMSETHKGAESGLAKEAEAGQTPLPFEANTQTDWSSQEMEEIEPTATFSSPEMPLPPPFPTQEYSQEANRPGKKRKTLPPNF